MPFGAAHWPYIIILLVVVLIIWGPGKLPDLGAGMGKAIREFKRASSDVRDHVVNSTASEPAESTPPATPLATPPPAEVSQPAAPAEAKEGQTTPV